MSLNLNQLTHSQWAANEKTRRGKIQDSLAMLLKTNGEKMSIFRPLAILLKNKELQAFSRDIYEKKGSYGFGARVSPYSFREERRFRGRSTLIRGKIFRSEERRVGKECRSR